MTIRVVSTVPRTIPEMTVGSDAGPRTLEYGVVTEGDGLLTRFGVRPLCWTRGDVRFIKTTKATAVASAPASPAEMRLRHCPGADMPRLFRNAAGGDPSASWRRSAAHVAQEATWHLMRARWSEFSSAGLRT